MDEFIVNPYISLRLEHGETMIYVANQPFKQCKLLLLNIPIAEMSTFDDLESIDEIAEEADRMMESEMMRTEIPPDVEFWGHCSNLQVWYEHDYDTRLIHSNLAFPLLKKLTEVGDPLAKKVFKSEIIKRYEDGNENTRAYLGVEGFLQYLTIEEHLDLLLDIENLIPLTELAEEVWPDRDPYEVIFMLMGKRIKLENKRVIKLDFSGLNLELDKFPKAILNLKSLKVLYFGRNYISDIPEEIKKLSYLRELGIGSNELSFIPDSICEINSLDSLWLGGNKIQSLPENIGDLLNLKKLRLQSNCLKELPESFSKLESLENLSLSNNQLKHLPDSFCNLKSLKWLSLSNNNLHELPECFKNLKSLEYLDMSRNPLVKNPEIVKKIEKLKIKRINGIKRKRKPKSFRIF